MLRAAAGRKPPDAAQEVLQLRHPAAERGAAEAAAEAVTPLLIDVHLGDRAGTRQVHEELRVAQRRPLIAGRREQKRRRKVFERFARRRSSGAVDERQVVGSRADAIDRIGGARIAGARGRDDRSAHVRSGREADVADPRRIELPRRRIGADDAERRACRRALARSLRSAARADRSGRTPSRPSRCSARRSRGLRRRTSA